MLYQPLMDKLHAMKLHGMAAAMEEQRNDPNASALTFEDRLGLLVDRQYVCNQDRALRNRLRYAGLSPDGPCAENVNYRAERSLSRRALDVLFGPEWIRQGQHLLLTGPTGVGKSYIAEALARQACRNGFRTLMFYSPKLFRTLRTAELDGSLPKLLARLARTALLVIDDFGLERAAPADYRLFLEVLQDRIGKTSTLVTTQYAVSVWHQLINDDTVADAICDRLAHASHRIDLTGKSMRDPDNLKHRSPAV